MFVVKRESSRLAEFAIRDCGKGKEEVGQRESERRRVTQWEREAVIGGQRGWRV